MNNANFHMENDNGSLLTYGENIFLYLIENYKLHQTDTILKKKTGNYTAIIPPG